MARGTPALIRLIRLPGCLTASADSITAALVAAASGGLVLSPWRVVAAAVASFCLYAFGIVVGDVLDVEKDKRLHPGRPLPSGEIPTARARRAAAGFLAVGLGAALAAGPVVLAFAAATALAVFLHQRVVRRRETTGAVGMAACRVLNLLLGAAAAGSVTALPTLVPVATGLYVLSLTGISAFEERRSPRPLLVALIVLLLTSVLVPFPALPQRGFPLATAAPLFLILLWRAARARFDTSPRTVGMLVGRAVTGLLLLDAAYLFGHGRAAAAVVLVILYLLLRIVRRPGVST